MVGLRLGDTPANVVAWLRESYPQCDLQRSVYHALPGERVGPLAIVAINEGTINVCHGVPEDKDATDIIVVRFAHPSIAVDRGAFEILVDRRYPDALATPKKQVRYPLDKALRLLRREYGSPTHEQRQPGAPQSASLDSPLVVGANVKRGDETVRLLWAPKGKLVEGQEPGECDCGGRYVIAEIETTRSPATRPANRPYVTRVSVFAQQADVRHRQDVWNAQWLRRGPPAPPESKAPDVQPHSTPAAAPSG